MPARVSGLNVVPFALAPLKLSTLAEASFLEGATFASRPTDAVDAGGQIIYLLALRNCGDGAAKRLTIRLDPPSNAVYAPGSTAVNGVPLLDFVGTSPLLSSGGLTLGDVGVGAEVVVRLHGDRQHAAADRHDDRDPRLRRVGRPGGDDRARRAAARSFDAGAADRRGGAAVHRHRRRRGSHAGGAPGQRGAPVRDSGQRGANGHTRSQARRRSSRPHRSTNPTILSLRLDDEKLDVDRAIPRGGALRRARPRPAASARALSRRRGRRRCGDAPAAARRTRSA